MAKTVKRTKYGVAFLLSLLMLTPSLVHAQQNLPCPATGNAAPHATSTYVCYTHKTLSPAVIAGASVGAAALVGVTIWAVRRHHHHHAAAATPPASPTPAPHSDSCLIDGLWVKAECAQPVKP